MLHQPINRWIFILMLVFLAGCSISANNLGSITPDPSGTVPTVTQVSSVSLLVTVVPTASPSTPPVEAAISTSTPSLAPSPLPSVTNTSSRNLTTHDECPTFLSSDMPPLWSYGSLLYSFDLSGIWAISAVANAPERVYSFNTTQPSLIKVSADGEEILLQFTYIDQIRGVEQETIIFDLNDRQEIRLPIQTGSWNQVWDWLPDGHIKYLVDLETIEDGEVREFIVVDPVTGVTKETVERFELPDYIMNETVLYDGVASIDPTGRFALYNSFDGQNSEIVLRDLQDGSIIWKHQGSMHGTSYPRPQWQTPEPIWSTDGRHVLFGAVSRDTNGVFWQFFDLTQNGESDQVLPQSVLSIDEWKSWTLRYVNHSPNGRFLNFGLGSIIGTEGSPPLQDRGPGFIYDTKTRELMEICDPSAIFLDGHWISEDQFLYRVQLENENQSLRVLDIPAWSTQSVFESSQGSGLNFYGWTSVELH